MNTLAPTQAQQIAFTKGAGKFDRMDLIRAGQVAESVDCPKQGILPHDMVHCAVEGLLQRRGFILRILAGEPASYRMEGDAETDGVERLVEVFQADGWDGWTSTAADMLALYQVTCTARGCPPLALAEADIEVVRQRLLELNARWQALAVGERLVFSADGELPQI